jgi:hypothetical protein
MDETEQNVMFRVIDRMDRKVERNVRRKERRGIGK